MTSAYSILESDKIPEKEVIKMRGRYLLKKYRGREFKQFWTSVPGEKSVEELLKVDERSDFKQSDRDRTRGLLTIDQ